MKLYEALKIYENQIVCIGAKSSYMYIGIPDEEMIQKTSDIYREHFIHCKDKVNGYRIKTLMKRVRTEQNNLVKMDKKYKIDIKCADDKQKVMKKRKNAISEQLKLIKRVRRTVDQKLRYVQKLQSTIYNWTDFKDREVIDIYTRIDGRTAIIIEGIEEGKLW